MAHAQKPDLVFQRNGRVHLNRRGCQFSRLLAAEKCGSADSSCIGRVPTYSGRLLATYSIRIFPLHFPSRAPPCAIRFRTRYTFTTADAHTSAASSRLKLLISCYNNTRGTINIVNTSVTFELRLEGINAFADITSISRIYIQYQFMSEDISAQTPNMLHLPFTDLIY